MEMIMLKGCNAKANEEGQEVASLERLDWVFPEEEWWAPRGVGPLQSVVMKEEAARDCEIKLSSR